jgi:hypothetical protein
MQSEGADLKVHKATQESAIQNLKKDLQIKTSELEQVRNS